MSDDIYQEGREMLQSLIQDTIAEQRCAQSEHEHLLQLHLAPSSTNLAQAILLLYPFQEKEKGYPVHHQADILAIILLTTIEQEEDCAIPTEEQEEYLILLVKRGILLDVRIDEHSILEAMFHP